MVKSKTSVIAEIQDFIEESITQCGAQQHPLNMIQRSIPLEHETIIYQ
ncbi:hypothetical protein HORM4_660023 [Vibrio harveyi]|nr:hypothetical protein HORM4_660023 [Vibrio harveyi]